MDTKILTTTDEDLKIAAKILKDGGNVIFPTETVYGLGADAKCANAIKNIFKAKGRPSDNPLIVHISSYEQLTDIAKDIPAPAKLLMDKFWPGALTIILNKCKNVPYETTGGLNTVAVRMPSSDVARRLIELSGLPLAAPSANISGKPSPTTAEHCIFDMDGRVDAIICGEDCSVGVESTVIDMTGDIPVLLRPGKITAEEIEECIGKIQVVTSVGEGEKPKSPGLKYKHYSPNAEVIILSGNEDDVIEYIKRQTGKIGVLTFDEFSLPSEFESISLGSINKPQEAARRLFGALREMDKRGVKTVFAPEISNSGMWSAVRNRLYRAAGEKIVKVSKADKKHILFVCTGNTCRSPMAEALFNDIAVKNGINAESTSAGIYASGEASINSVLAMAELLIDIKGRNAVQVTYDMVNKADLVLTMSDSHKMALVFNFGNDEKIMTLNEFAGEDGEIDDPFGMDIEAYRECRDKIRRLIEKAIEKL